MKLFLWNYCGGPAYGAFYTGFVGVLCYLPFITLYRKDEQKRNRLKELLNRNGNRRTDMQSKTGDPPDRGAIVKIFDRRGLSFTEGIILIFMGAAAGLYGNLILGIIIQMLGSFIPSSWSSEIIGNYISYSGFFFLVIWLVAAAPVAEEMLFRWLVFLRIRDHMSRKWAIILSALAFGIFHGDVLQGIYAFLLGIIFAIILERTGSLLSSVLMHMGANFYSVIMSKYYEEVITHIDAYGFLAIYVLLLLVLILGFRYFNES